MRPLHTIVALALIVGITLLAPYNASCRPMDYIRDIETDLEGDLPPITIIPSNILGLASTRPVAKVFPESIDPESIDPESNNLEYTPMPRPTDAGVSKQPEYNQTNKPKTDPVDTNKADDQTRNSTSSMWIWISVLIVVAGVSSVLCILLCCSRCCKCRN